MWRQIRGRALGALVTSAGLATGVVLPSVTSIAAESTQTEVQRQLQLGENPFPVHLQRPRTAPLSAVAQIGKRIFFDPSLSASGSLSCSSCHSPDHFYGPVGAASAVFGGPNMSAQGTRAVPSLMYLERQPGFSVGPDNDENEDATLAQMVAQRLDTKRVTKKADNAAQAAANLVPQGDLFWDGRADTLQDQAIGALLNPLEMANSTVEDVAQRLLATTYIERLAQIFGTSVLSDPKRLVSEAMFAVGRFQIEDKSFHPYSSKFDAWLEGMKERTQYCGMFVTPTLRNDASRSVFFHNGVFLAAGSCRFSTIFGTSPREESTGTPFRGRW